MELYELLPQFHDDSFEWIESMEDSILYLEEAPGCLYATYSLFRAIDRVRESAGLFGMGRVIELARAMEAALIRATLGKTPYDEHLAALLLACCERMKVLVGQASSDDRHLDSVIVESELLDMLEEAASRTCYEGVVRVAPVVSRIQSPAFP